jgi:hypothetical protein
MMRIRVVLMVFLLFGLYGCAPTYQGSISSHQQEPSLRRPSPEPVRPPPSTGSTSTLTKSDNFMNNTDTQTFKRAAFGLSTEDCRNNRGEWGIYIIGFVNSEAQKRGLQVGDALVEIGAHTPRNSGHLTEIIERLTPNNLYNIVVIRNDKKISVSVIPPEKIYTIETRERLKSPRTGDQKQCWKLGFTSK